jgi:hypothetical protein
MLPSISQSSLSINESACRSQQASCLLPLPNMWSTSDAYRFDNGTATQSSPVEAASWDQDYATLLNMEGSGRHIKNRMTLYRDNDYEDAVFLDGLALDISANYTARYSTDAGYTINAGFVSAFQIPASLTFRDT